MLLNCLLFYNLYTSLIYKKQQKYQYSRHCALWRLLRLCDLAFDFGITGLTLCNGFLPHYCAFTTHQSKTKKRSHSFFHSFISFLSSINTRTTTSIFKINIGKPPHYYKTDDSKIIRHEVCLLKQILLAVLYPFSSKHICSKLINPCWNFFTS